MLWSLIWLLLKWGISVKKAVKVMNDFEIGCLIVVEKGQAIGIITERDVLKRIVVESRNPEETLVRDIMSKPLIVVGPETSLEEAIEVMFKHKIKKLPVIDGGKLVGLVTFIDIARVQPVMEKTIRRLMEKYKVPRRINKVIKYYIA